MTISHMWCTYGSPSVNPEHTAAERVLDRQTHTRFHWAGMGSKHTPAGTVEWVVVAAQQSLLRM